MSEPIQSIAQNNYILATQQEVSHDNTLSGNGTVHSPLGIVPSAVGTQIITTVENIASKTVDKYNDTAFSKDITKEGYTPIAFIIMNDRAGNITVNCDSTTTIENNTLKLKVYSRGVTSTSYNVTIKVLITWMKI